MASSDSQGKTTYKSWHLTPSTFHEFQSLTIYDLNESCTWHIVLFKSMWVSPESIDRYIIWYNYVAESFTLWQVSSYLKLSSFILSVWTGAFYHFHETFVLLALWSCACALRTHGCDCMKWIWYGIERMLTFS